jgi:hypothetical protein
MWLARVGPSPLDPWRYAMGWGEVAARNHARRLEREGWLERVRRLRGDGSLFFVTRKGVRMLDVPLMGCTTPTPTWWAHDVACAWTAAWLAVREPRRSSSLQYTMRVFRSLSSRPHAASREAIMARSCTACRSLRAWTMMSSQ